MATAPAVARSMGDLGDEELLGFLEFHTVTNLRIHKDDLAGIFRQNMLDTKKVMPQEIKPHDAFRRATKEAESQISVDYNGAKHKARLMVREVVSDSNIVERHLVREIIDVKNRKLTHVTVGKFILQKKTGTMDTSVDLNYVDEYPYDQHIDQIQALFHDWTEYHTRETVSNIVRRVITSMNHVSIMPNGKATFIPKTQRTKLDALRGVIEDLKDYHTGDQSIIEIIPIIDTVEQREMVEKRVEAQMSQEANILMADFATILDNDKLSVRVVKGYAQKVVALQEKLEEYEGLIHKKMDTLQNQLADALSKIQTSGEE